MSKKLSRAYNVIVMTTLIGLLVIAFGVYSASYFVKITTIQHAQKKLETLVHDRSTTLIRYVEDRIAYGEKIARNEVIQNAFIQLQGDDVNDDIQRTLTVFLEETGTDESYKNTLLISKEGRVLFSDFAPEYVGINLARGAHSTSDLGESFMRVIMGLTADIAQIGYDNLLQRPAFFVLIPVFRQEKLLGIIAQEIVMEKLGDILNDIKGLGVSGEILFAEQEQEGIVIINKSRFTQIEPFKRFIFYQKISPGTEEYSIAQALEGYSGSGLLINDKGQTRVGAWQYIPKVQWGVCAHRSIHEVESIATIMRSSAWALLGMWLLLVALFYIYNEWFRHVLQHSMSKVRPKVPILLWCIVGVAACIFILYCYWFIRDAHVSLRTIKHEVETRSTTTKKNIEKFLKHSELVGRSLTANITNDFIKKDTLKQHLHNIMRDYPTIIGITVAYAPYAYTKEKRLFSVFAKRKGVSQDIEFEEYPYDYTTINPSSVWGWYTLDLPYQSIKWLQAYFDAETGLLVGGYSMTFFDKHDVDHTTPKGVINIQFNLDPIKNIMHDLEFGRLGYSYLLLSNGEFIYHPIEHYVSARENLYNLAHEGGNDRLSEIASAIIAGGDGFYTYKEPAVTGEKIWLYATHISPAGWIMNSVFSQEDAALPMSQIRSYCMILLAIGTILLLFFFLAMNGTAFSVRRSATMLTILLGISQIGLLAIIWGTPIVQNLDIPIVVSDQATVNRFLKDQDIYSQRIHEEITTKIPLGIFITSLGFKNSTTIEIAGYLWEKFPVDSDPSFLREVSFSHAVEPAIFKKMYEKKDKTGITVGWEFTAKLAQKFDYARYPFDAIMLKIGMEYPDRSKAVLLVPAVDNYHSIVPSAIPGIDNTLFLSGYTFQKAFFGYDVQKNDVNFGLDKFKNGTEKTQLVHIVMMSRSLLYDFVVVLLPIFIIFFCLFTVLTITERQRMRGLSVLAAYTGLIFVVVTLHKTLRDRLVFGDILYIEYLFFMIYLTFALLVLFTLFKLYAGRIHYYVQGFLNFYKVFFWSIQLLTLFVITFIVFYPW